MLPANADVSAQPRQLSCKLVIGNNTITDVKLLTYASDWSGNIAIGQVVSSYISVTIPTPNFSLLGANVSLSMGISSPVEWVSIGQFKVDEESIKTRQGYTTFTAYDKLHDSPTTYHSALTFPATLQNICNEVCSALGITSASLGVSYTVEEDILSGYTLRDVLGFIAAFCGKNAYLSPSGALDLRWFTNATYTANNRRANVPYIGERNCVVNRLICQNADGTITSGSGEGIYFTCPIMTQSRLDTLQANLSGFSYRKADVDIRYGNFCLQSGDIITVTTTGESLTVPIMANSWTYDGGVSSSVSSYGVSDYNGTANNAERSATAQRVQGILDTKRAVSREKQQYTTVTQDILRATELITGATGGYIKLEFGGNGKTAQLLVMDQPSMDDALNVWIFNQNGLGHKQRAAKTDPFSTVNVALTREGTVVAERIAGQKISGVKFESTPTGSGEQPQVLVENGNYKINKVNSGTVTNVGGITFKNRQAVDQVDSLAIQVELGKSVTIGTTSNPEFIYYSDPSQAPSSAEKFQFYGNIRLFGDLLFGNGADLSLVDTKTFVDSLYSENIVGRIEALEQRMADLEDRVSALED